MQANVGRLTEMQGYLSVRAPFAGVVTLRNVDVGTLINTGNTMPFRTCRLIFAPIGTSRNPAPDVHVEMASCWPRPSLEHKLMGTVTRTANAMDPSSRTLLVEVQVPNPEGKLLPGMYVEGDSYLSPGESTVAAASRAISTVCPEGH